MQMAAARTAEAQTQMAGQYKALAGGRRRRIRGGELSIPAGLISAGGSDPAGGFAKLDNLLKQAGADGAGDDPVSTGGPVGGRRRKTTARKHNGGKHSTLRKSRRTRRRSRHVRHSRR